MSLLKAGLGCQCQIIEQEQSHLKGLGSVGPTLMLIVQSP